MSRVPGTYTVAPSRRMTLLELAMRAELRERGESASVRESTAAARKVAPVVGFVVLWALMLGEHQGEEGLTIEDYIADGFESRRTSYRRLKEFRRLFPDEHDPDRFARLVMASARRQRVQPSATVAIAV